MTTHPVPYMPFAPTPPNPARASCAPRVWQWIDEAGLADDEEVRRLLRRADPELTTARYFPAADPELFVYLARLMAWIFVNDDQFDDGRLGRDPALCRSAVAARLGVLDGVPAPGVMERALAELWSRLPEGRSPGWYATLRHDLRAFLGTYTVECEERHAGRVPPLDAYLAHRRDTAGTRWCAVLMEVAVGVDLPDEVRRLPAYRALKDAAAGHCGLFNDIHSIGKERASEQIHNAVRLLMHHQGRPLDAALRLVNDMATGCVGAFEEAALALPRTDAVDRWVTGVRHLVRGNVDWHFESERYRGDLSRMRGAA
ncbi:terpene cyclase [Streptomyces sp. B6B3]|uniref:terpene synthase family protein n=1 Tax=Streptomyces sp. B6B3 TaxID=3153570 RepID=UPI00325E44DF